MRIKNLRRAVSEVRFKKTWLLRLEHVENHLIRNFQRNGRVSVKEALFKKIISKSSKKNIHDILKQINFQHLVI